MDEDVLEALSELLGEELPGLQAHGPNMQVTFDARYGRVVLRFDFDETTQSIRMYTAVPPPAGGGTEFLLWCLTTNTLYWDVKIGLDAQGMLLVHSDVDLDQADLTSTARVLLERVVAMRELLDDDLVSYLLRNKLATPTQEERWRKG
ncbi:MAG TPA: hypothetical protein VHM19_18530 [Polyangiales bacterium]|jgi:hypothetical protein|nr:hypothetical protein [Polyangiales bacterium]